MMGHSSERVECVTPYVNPTTRFSSTKDSASGCVTYSVARGDPFQHSGIEIPFLEPESRANAQMTRRRRIKTNGFVQVFHCLIILAMR